MGVFEIGKNHKSCIFFLHRVICWTIINIPLLNSSNTPYTLLIVWSWHYVLSLDTSILYLPIESHLQCPFKILLKYSISGSCALLLTPCFLCLLRWPIPVAHVAQVPHCLLSFPNMWALTCESLGVTSLCNCSKFSNKKVQIYQQHFSYFCSYLLNLNEKAEGKCRNYNVVRPDLF